MVSQTVCHIHHSWMNRAGGPELCERISPFLVHRPPTRFPKAMAVMRMVTGNFLKVLGFGSLGFHADTRSLSSVTVERPRKGVADVPLSTGNSKVLAKRGDQRELTGGAVRNIERLQGLRMPRHRIRCRFGIVATCHSDLEEVGTTQEVTQLTCCRLRPVGYPQIRSH